MPLSFVDPPAAPEHFRAILYGPPGTGKTVGACSAPGPILVVNAEGPGALFFARKLHGNDKIREVAFETAKTLDETYLALKDGDLKVKTVVVDTVGETYKSLLAAYGGPRPTQQQYGDVNTKVERFVRSLRDLPVNVVLVCHEQLVEADGELIRRPETGGRKLPETVMAMVDFVAYCGVIPETDDKPRRYVGQLVEQRGRRAKDRSGALGASRDLDLSEWFAAASKALAPPKNNTRRAAA